MSGERLPLPEYQMTEAQVQALGALCARYQVDFKPEHYHPAHGGIDSLPEGWYAGWAGGLEIQATRRTVYCGVSPEGSIYT